MPGDVPPSPDRNPPAVSPAVQAGAATGAAAGIAAAKAAAEFGSMGLNGAMRAWGNATAMLFIVVALGFVYRDMRADVTTQRADMLRQRAGEVEERAALVGAIRELRSESQANRQAVEALTAELRSRPLRP